MYMIVSEFLKWLKTINYSDSTIKNYLATLVLFDDYVRGVSFGERGVEYPHTIELEDIEEFAERERLRGKEIRTVNNYLAWIKKFLRFCNHKWLDVMDHQRIVFAREPEYKINALEENEMKNLLNYMRTDSSKEEIVRMRDYAMWLVLTYWWLRVSELVNLKVQDIKENMQIIGKWWSRRLVCLYSDYVKVIELYLFLRRKLKINSDYVFVSHSNNSRWKPLSRASVEDIISKAWKKVWITVRPHKLRHTCATQMLSNGGDIVYISQILGHKNISTTQTYLDYCNDKLKKTQLLIPKL